MHLFDVYPLLPVTPVAAQGCTVTDAEGTEYLDLYGGHAVISIGHQHPHWVSRIQEQLSKLSFYSNSVQNPLQQQLAHKLGAQSGCSDYQLFLCNSGAEANENALKLASFVTGRAGIICFDKGFHGRTSAAVAATDNPRIHAGINAGHEVHRLPLNDLEALEQCLQQQEIAALIVEPIQGVGGLDTATDQFLQGCARLCKTHGALLITDEVQTGYGRSGHFFAHQRSGITPDLISIAKGMGNGFPVGGVLIAPDIEPWHGMLGTTFGGNHLACAAALAVLEVLEQESLISAAANQGAYLASALAAIPGVQAVKGRGLMLGAQLDFTVAALRKRLVLEQHHFTGAAADKHLLRLLPPLSISQAQVDTFIQALQTEISHELNTVRS